MEKMTQEEFQNKKQKISNLMHRTQQQLYWAKQTLSQQSKNSPQLYNDAINKAININKICFNEICSIYQINHNKEMFDLFDNIITNFQTIIKFTLFVSNEKNQSEYIKQQTGSLTSQNTSNQQLLQGQEHCFNILDLINPSPIILRNKDEQYQFLDSQYQQTKLNQEMEEQLYLKHIEVEAVKYMREIENNNYKNVKKEQNPIILLQVSQLLQREIIDTHNMSQDQLGAMISKIGILSKAGNDAQEIKSNGLTGLLQEIIQKINQEIAQMNYDTNQNPQGNTYTQTQYEHFDYDEINQNIYQNVRKGFNQTLQKLITYFIQKQETVKTEVTGNQTEITSDFIIQLQQDLNSYIDKQTEQEKFFEVQLSSREQQKDDLRNNLAKKTIENNQLTEKIEFLEEQTQTALLKMQRTKSIHELMVDQFVDQINKLQYYNVRYQTQQKQLSAQFQKLKNINLDISKQDVSDMIIKLHFLFDVEKDEKVNPTQNFISQQVSQIKFTQFLHETNFSFIQKKTLKKFLSKRHFIYTQKKTKINITQKNKLNKTLFNFLILNNQKSNFKLSKTNIQKRQSKQITQLRMILSQQKQNNYQKQITIEDILQEAKSDTKFQQYISKENISSNASSTLFESIRRQSVKQKYQKQSITQPIALQNKNIQIQQHYDKVNKSSQIDNNQKIIIKQKQQKIQMPLKLVKNTQQVIEQKNTFVKKRNQKLQQYYQDEIFIEQQQPQRNIIKQQQPENNYLIKEQNQRQVNQEEDNKKIKKQKINKTKKYFITSNDFFKINKSKKKKHQRIFSTIQNNFVPDRNLSIKLDTQQKQIKQDRTVSYQKMIQRKKSVNIEKPLEINTQLEQPKIQFSQYINNKYNIKTNKEHKRRNSTTMNIQAIKVPQQKIPVSDYTQKIKFQEQKNNQQPLEQIIHSDDSSEENSISSQSSQSIKNVKKKKHKFIISRVKSNNPIMRKNQQNSQIINLDNLILNKKLENNNQQKIFEHVIQRPATQVTPSSPISKKYKLKMELIKSKDLLKLNQIILNNQARKNNLNENEATLLEQQLFSQINKNYLTQIEGFELLEKKTQLQVDQLISKFVQSHKYCGYTCSHIHSFIKYLASYSMTQTLSNNKNLNIQNFTFN